jgi:two-component system, LytTR family, response regulator
MLEQFCSHLVSIAAVCQDSEEAISLVLEKHPDLIFLEIDLPHINGFQLLERIKDLHFEIIFITTFDEYAVRAFNYSAIDYLLKPVKPVGLIQAVERCQKKVSEAQHRCCARRRASPF